MTFMPSAVSYLFGNDTTIVYIYCSCSPKQLGKEKEEKKYINKARENIT